MEEHTVEKQEKEDARQQGEEPVKTHRKEEAEESVTPQRQAWNGLKAKHPDALQLIRGRDAYRLYNEDAVRGAEILGIPLEKREGNPDKGFTASAEFPLSLLDTYLSKLVKAGERIAICELPAAPERTGTTERQARATEEQNENEQRPTFRR